jgi:hypothetical protein
MQNTFPRFFFKSVPGGKIYGKSNLGKSGNMDTYRILKYAAQSTFFFIKCRLFHNFIFLGSYNIHVLLKRALNFT